jgi:Mlc titration factor MtfA (ptsG expression regulator)
MGIFGRLFDRERDDNPFPAGWLAVVRDRLAPWPTLSTHEQLRLLDLTAVLVDDKRWEAANGFALTDEIRLTIAAHAALLILALDYECYREITSIIVHPATITMRGPRAGPVRGVIDDGPQPILGSAHYKGPVLIAWDAASQQARHPERGHNVVYHEFAHRLDMLDGLVDGTPPLASPAHVQQWVEVCTAEFEALRHHPDPLLDDYAATNPAEFFAVVTEVFFNRGRELEAAKPALYGVLRDFYRQDPARRFTDLSSS